MNFTDEQIKELRTHMTMKTFNFKLDNVTKLLVIQKLKSAGVENDKGSISALIRVLLNYFVELIPDDPTFEYMIEKVQEEYIFTTKKNKRSSM